MERRPAMGKISLQAPAHVASADGALVRPSLTKVSGFYLYLLISTSYKSYVSKKKVLSSSDLGKLTKTRFFLHFFVEARYVEKRGDI